MKLLDVSRADAPSVTIAEQESKPAGRQVPIAFELPYDAPRIEERHRYVLQVRILEGIPVTAAVACEKSPGTLGANVQPSPPVVTCGELSIADLV